MALRTVTSIHAAARRRARRAKNPRNRRSCTEHAAMIGHWSGPTRLVTRSRVPSAITASSPRLRSAHAGQPARCASMMARSPSTIPTSSSMSLSCASETCPCAMARAPCEDRIRAEITAAICPATWRVPVRAARVLCLARCVNDRQCRDRSNLRCRGVRRPGVDGHPTATSRRPNRVDGSVSASRRASHVLPLIQGPRQRDPPTGQRARSVDVSRADRCARRSS